VLDLAEEVGEIVESLRITAAGDGAPVVLAGIDVGKNHSSLRYVLSIEEPEVQAEDIGPRTSALTSSGPKPEHSSSRSTLRPIPRTLPCSACPEEQPECRS